MFSGAKNRRRGQRAGHDADEVVHRLLVALHRADELLHVRRRRLRASRSHRRAGTPAANPDPEHAGSPPGHRRRAAARSAHRRAPRRAPGASRNASEIPNAVIGCLRYPASPTSAQPAGRTGARKKPGRVAGADEPRLTGGGPDPLGEVGDQLERLHVGALDVLAAGLELRLRPLPGRRRRGRRKGAAAQPRPSSART